MVVKAKPITQAVVHRLPVTSNQTRVAPSLVGGSGISPQVMPQPFPPVPLDLQKLIVSSQRPPNPKAALLGPTIPKASGVKTGKAIYNPPYRPPESLRLRIRKTGYDSSL